MYDSLDESFDGRGSLRLAHGARLEVRLQNQYGCQLVDNLFPTPVTHGCFVEYAVRLNRSEPLIEEMHGQLKAHSQQFGKLFHFFRLRACLAAHAQRQTYHDLADVIAPDCAAEMIKVIALVGAVQRGKALRREAEFVGDGQADPSGSVVHRKNSYDSRFFWHGRSLVFHIDASKGILIPTYELCE